MKRKSLEIAILLFQILLACPAARGVTRIVAYTGRAEPDGGVFGQLDDASLNNQGVAAFLGSVRTGPATGISGILIGEGGDARFSGDVTDVVQYGDPIPGVPGATLESIRDPAINAHGDILFLGSDENSGPGEGPDGIYLASGGSFTPIARAGSAPPEGNGTFLEFYSSEYGFNYPAFNDAGQTAFHAALTGTSGVNTDNAGLYLGDAQSLRLIARKGDEVPGSGERILGFNVAADDIGTPALNNLGDVAFSARLTNSESGIFLHNGTGLTQVAMTGEASPIGGATFQSLAGPRLTEQGDVAFWARVEDEQRRETTGIFLWRDGQIDVLARSGVVAPDGNGNFADIYGFDINEAGQVAFQAYIENSGIFFVEFGVYVTDGMSIQKVARSGDAPPDDNGAFRSFYAPLINDAGQIAFLAHIGEVAPFDGDEEGLYVYDDALGLIEVTRTGDELLGRRISHISFHDSLDVRARGRRNHNSWRQFNDDGSLAYRVLFDEVDDAVVIFQVVPEPTSVALIAAPLSLLFLLRVPCGYFSRPLPARAACVNVRDTP
jgi:hypothetical protein